MRVYIFDYNNIDISDTIYIRNNFIIHKYLMEKHDIKLNK